MKRLLTLFLLVSGLTVAAAAQSPLATAQKVEKPTLTAQPPTPAQSATIEEAVGLFQARDFDGSIAKLDAVLKENPDCAEAKYQLALSLYNKPDHARADAVARDGARYKSNVLPMFYTMIGNILDDAGQAAEAIDLYKRGIELLKKDSSRQRFLAEAEYNLAYTYVRQKQYPEARASLKEAVATNFGHVNSHLLLAFVYKGTGYKVPALLAATRLLGLERDTPQAKQAAAMFLEILKPAAAAKDKQTGQINILLNMNAPKDEGDFSVSELILGTVTTVRGDEDKGKTDGQMYADGVASMFAITAEDKDLKKFFVGKYYVPYIEAMKSAGHQEAFAYVVLQLGGDAEGAKWVAGNPDKVTAYFNWAKSYQSTAH